jgi:formylglycine-generating enzyme required for sulfatase activity
MNRLDVLILAANPTAPARNLDRELGFVDDPAMATYPPLQLDQEIRQIRAEIHKGLHRDRVSLDPYLAASPDDLLEALDESPANVLHFMGHSEREGIVLVGERNEAILIRTAALVMALEAAGERIKLVVLNSCKSMETARALAGVCGCAIGMKQKIRDPAAWTFSRTFYRALANGRSVRKAFDQGRAALAFRGLSEEDLPELMPCGVDPASIGLTDHGQPPSPGEPSRNEIETVHRENHSLPAGGIVTPASHKPQLSEAKAGAVLEIESPVSTPGLVVSSGTPISSIGMKLVPIPAGEFLMGSPDSDPDADDDEKPQHLVRITRPFLLAPWPVTQSQYQKVMGETPSYFKDQPENPVETVSWYDAVRFCNRLSEMEKLKPFYKIEGKSVTILSKESPGFRLPAEAEWEYACRAGSKARYSFGDDSTSLGEHAWYRENSGQKTQPVGKKRPNKFGLYDMHGNVWEWCWDGWDKDYYKLFSMHKPVVDPLGPSLTTFRVVRGGGWDFSPRSLWSAARVTREPDDKLVSLGFRVARGQSG